jgi:SAM-dependent methyltransferase
MAGPYGGRRDRRHRRTTAFHLRQTWPVTYPNPFATAADRYAGGRPYHHPRTLRRALAGLAATTALDVACGTGLSTRALAELGIAAVGVDVAPAMVVRARADTGLPYAVATAEALPVATGSVDLVTVGSGVHWLDQDRFAVEAARVLRPGGVLLLYEHAGPALPVEPAFPDWLRGTYLRRYPGPPRGPMAADFAGGGSFALERTDRWLDVVRMTRDQFVAYLMTQSNVVDEPPERIRAWLDTELARFLPGDRARPVTFQGSYWLLRRVR